MKSNVLKVNDEFLEVGITIIDDQQRLTIGRLFQNSKKVRLYKNKRGEVLMQPITDVPDSELWLYNNKDSFEAVRQGLKDAGEGKISKLDIDKL